MISLETRTIKICSTTRSVRSGQNAFHHDGGETIYSLPNGFQAYYLNKATGERLDKGPTAIVARSLAQGFLGHQRHLLYGVP